MSRPSRPVPLTLFGFAALSVLAADGCMSSPQTEAKRQEQMLQLGDAVNEMRNLNDEIRITLDSIRAVVAKQDSTIARLANVTGVVVVK